MSTEWEWMVVVVVYLWIYSQSWWKTTTIKRWLIGLIPADTYCCYRPNSMWRGGERILTVPFSFHTRNLPDERLVVASEYDKTFPCLSGFRFISPILSAYQNLSWLTRSNLLSCFSDYWNKYFWGWWYINFNLEIRIVQGLSKLSVKCFALTIKY